MATALGQLSGLAQIANLVGGQSSTTTSTKSGTQTQQTLLSQEAMDRLLNQILAGTGGVKTIAGAARGAGLYNSSTEEQLLNDLSVRAAGEVAAKSAPTVATSSETGTSVTKTPGMGIMPLALGAGALSLAKPLLTSLFADSAASAVAPAAADAAVAGATGALGSAAPAATNVIGGAIGDSLKFLDGGADPIGAIAELVGAGASNIGIGTDLASAGADIFGSGVPISGVLSGLLNGTDGLSAEGLGLSSAMALAMGSGPLAPIVAPLALLGGSIFGNASIICTALQARGLLDKDLYAKGQEYLRNVSAQTKRGYYFWATSVANKVKAGNPWAIALTLPAAVSRTSLLSTEGTLLDHLRHPLGTLTKFIGEPICWIIGGLVTDQHPRVANIEGE